MEYFEVLLEVGEVSEAKLKMMAYFIDFFYFYLVAIHELTLSIGVKAHS